MTARAAGWRAVALLVLAALTIGLHLGLGRFVVDGPVWLTMAAPVDWRRLGDVTLADGVITIRNGQPRGSAGVERAFTPPAHALYLNVAAEVAVTDVRRGALPWQSARIILAARTPEGAVRWGLPHEVMRLSGTSPWRGVERTFAVAAGAAPFVSAHLVDATGQMTVRNLMVREARVRPWFDAAAAALAVGWAAAGLWLLWPVLRAARRDALAAAIVLFLAFILVATVTPQTARVAVREQLAPLAPMLGEAAGGVGAAATPIVTDGPNPLWQSIDGAGHFMSYAVLALLVLWAMRRRGAGWAWPPLAGLAALACLTEVLQFFAGDRRPAIGDALTNLGGLATGAALFALLNLRGRPGGAAAPPPDGRSEG